MVLTISPVAALEKPQPIVAASDQSRAQRKEAIIRGSLRLYVLLSFQQNLATNPASLLMGAESQSPWVVFWVCCRTSNDEACGKRPLGAII